MSLLSSAELTDLRAIQEDNMPLRCTIQRPLHIGDGQGGHTTGWTDLVTNVPCRKAVGRQPLEQRIADAPRSVQWWVLTIPWDQDIARRDRVIMGSVPYDVVGPLSDEDNLATARSVAIVRIV